MALAASLHSTFLGRSDPLRFAGAALHHLHTSALRSKSPCSASAAWFRKMEAKERYKDWSKDNLLSRIAELEAQSKELRALLAPADPGKSYAASSAVAAESESETSQSKRPKAKSKDKPLKQPRHFDFTLAPCRKIALRFSYDGAGYSGLAAQNTPSGTSASSLPTVESVLWDALCTARLVDPALGMEGAGFSRCGRTDRGVSAAGQVVALWVRSKKVNQWAERQAEMNRRDDVVSLQHGQEASTHAAVEDQEEAARQEARNSRLEAEELPYVQILNRILPATIRIQAWSPVRPSFSARFDCIYRHYKYFFPVGPPSLFFPSAGSSSSSSSTSTSEAATRLDIEAMRDAASRLLGEHDFRNLCKVDASKQITNYRRRIDGVSIDRVSSGWPSTPARVKDEDEDGDGDEEEDVDSEHMYVLNLRGTAFLYHQVRNIMSILFLVGARLEAPSVIEELMNVEKGTIAADRVKMRVAAMQGVKPTANGAPTQAEIKWWLPVKGTLNEQDSQTPPQQQQQAGEATTRSASDAEDWGVPMWIQQALSTDANEHSTNDEKLEVYTTKPNYEMAADRPLVLWECGFMPTDVEWRAGCYDGLMKEITQTQAEESMRSASSCLLRVHKSWTQQAISTELSRHFVLASASAHIGTLAPRTRYQDACFPYLARTKTTKEAEKKSKKDGLRNSGVVPLGNGTARGATNYIPLKDRMREDPFELKNARWMQTTGKRRAEKKAAALEEEHEAS